MAYALVSPLVAAILRNLNSLVVDEVGIAWGMTTELRNLQSTLTTIQAVLEDAESKQRKSKALEDWLKKLKDVAYDADNVVDSFTNEALRRRMEIERGLTSQVSTLLSLRNPLIYRFKMGHRIKNIRQKLDALAEEKNKFHLDVGVINDVKTNEMERGQTSSLVTESEIYGRHEEKQKIIEILLNDWTSVHDDLSVYAICGMGGLGKTTLARLVYNDRRVQTHFELKIWVCVSDDFGILRLTREIIEFIEGGPCNIRNVETLQHRLQEKLRGKRFLLVLDDVWNENHEIWDRLKEALKCGAKGSTVIVTTRSQDVVRIMSPHPPHDIEFLSEGDAWSLFKHRAFEVGRRDENLQLEKIGKDIVGKCRGVPLAIKALGDLLRYRSKESEWIFVRDNEIWDLFDDGRRILPALKVSYDNLAPHLRQCFAYCCIFPKDFEMKKDMLILLWMANGFIPSRARMDLYELGDEIFDDLVSRSFFQDVKVNDDFGGDVTCKMHDLMHDLAQSIVRHECCFLTEHSEIFKKIRHLCAVKELLLKNHWKDLNEVRSLRSLVILDGVYDSWDTFFAMLSKQKYLRVLVCNLRRWQLPTSISHLKHLRYLDFSDSFITTLPESTTCLQNLQTLKLRHCSYLRKLPRGTKYMRNLRYIDIRECNSLIHTPSGLGSLTCLQTLSIFIVGQKNRHNIGELKRLELQGELSIKKLGEVKNSVEATSANLKEKSNLVCLNLIWSYTNNIPDHVEEVLDGLRPHPNLKKLGIRSYKGSKFPDWLMGLALQNLVEVSLEDCHVCENLPPFGKLPVLEVLSLSGMHSVKYFNEECFEDGHNSFPALKSLKMWDMPNLEEWTTSGGGQRFSSLLDLKIEGCSKLKELPLLPTIERLKLFSSSDTLPRSLTNAASLISLEMDYFPNLNVLSGFENLNSLNTLCMDGFDSLTSLPENELRGLSSLRKLDIGNCKKLESLTEGVRYLTALQYLRIIDCPEIKSLPEGMQQLTALQTLFIYDCKGLYSLPSCLGSLPSLAELHIWSCQNMTSLPNGLLNTSGTLKSLDIRYCPGLSELCIRLAEDASHSHDDLHPWSVRLLPDGVQATRG